MGFNPVNFGKKNDIAEKTLQETFECDCPECRQTDAEAATALDALGRAQVNGIKPYVFNPKNVAKDLEEFGSMIDECMVIAFREGYYKSLINEGEDPDLAWKKADVAAHCFNPNL